MTFPNLVQLHNTFQKKNIIRLKKLPPLSIYIHVPWCIQNYPYCMSHTCIINNIEIPEYDYLNALRLDLEQSLPLIWNRPITSIFIGGCTPNLFSVTGFNSLQIMIRSLLRISSNTEITMEINPGLAKKNNICEYVKSGINRFSINAQSFNDTYLKKLGCTYDAMQVKKTIEMTKKFVKYINLDIMFALPKQKIHECLSDIQKAIEFDVNHLSCYELIIEQNTVLRKYIPELPSHDLVEAMQESISHEIIDKGFNHYETSSYCQSGCRSRHNLNYWEFGDYLGLGPGAHGKISFYDRIIRQIRMTDPKSWIRHVMSKDGSHIVKDYTINSKQLAFEFMLNVLSLKDGVKTNLFMERTGLSLTSITHKINRAYKYGLLDSNPKYLKASSKGWHFLNRLQEMFL